MSHQLHASVVVGGNRYVCQKSRNICYNLRHRLAATSPPLTILSESTMYNHTGGIVDRVQ